MALCTHCKWINNMRMISQIHGNFGYKYEKDHVHLIPETLWSSLEPHWTVVCPCTAGTKATSLVELLKPNTLISVIAKEWYQFHIKSIYSAIQRYHVEISRWFYLILIKNICFVKWSNKQLILITFAMSCPCRSKWSSTWDFYKRIRWNKDTNDYWVQIFGSSTKWT